MYVTRPLSMYRKDREAVMLEPPEGPNSGCLVIFDEEAETRTCFGLCNDIKIWELPFPQNKILKVVDGDFFEDVVFIPVLNQPLSSNRYYVIVQNGRHKGEAFTNSKKEDMSTCCFRSYVEDVRPKPLDPSDEYQQVEIIQHNLLYGFSAKSIVSDGFPPNFLRKKYWAVQMQTPKYYQLSQALGLNSSLRATLPSLEFPLSNDCSATVVVGKWYCPFMFVEEALLKLKDQVTKSMFYEMTLEQRWDKIFECENLGNHGNLVSINVVVETEDVCVAGRKGVWNEIDVKDKVVWFRSYGETGEEYKVGLNMVIVERMKWEQERVGWVSRSGRKERVERAEEFDGIDKWSKFGCYVLVERFELKRMDGSLVLTYDFKHTHQIRCKWE